MAEIHTLSKIAWTEPQATHAAFISGYQHKLTYHLRTFENLFEHLAPLDHVIDSHFSPAFLDGRICSENDRNLLSLPVKLGGLAIPLFSEIAERDSLIRKYVFDNKSLNTIKRDIVESHDQLNNQKLKNTRSL